MYLRWFAPLLLIVPMLVLPLRSSAQQVAEVDALLEDMQMAEIFDILRAEGLDYGAELADEMLGDPGDPRWTARVEAIYDTNRTYPRFRDRFRRELGGADIAGMTGFIRSDLGQRITDLEVVARRALLDPEVEAACRLEYDDAREFGTARLDAIRGFVEAGDLIDSNVTGAMNANYAFWSGMMEAGGLNAEYDQTVILNDVWAQEPELRAETEEWMYCYLLMALEPLDDAELETYTEFAESPAGRRLNRAMFVAFDEVFTDISLRLGRESARYYAAEEL